MTKRSGSFHGRASAPGSASSAIALALVSPRGLGAALALTLATSVVFGFVPGLDLATASLFYCGRNGFIGQAAWGEAARRAFVWVPFGLYAIVLALLLARRAGWTLHGAPAGRAIAFLTLSLALGPGLLVNTVLKDHSHRPRPVQVIEFGGTLPFRPFWRFDGGCKRNCSFVSGEGSTGFWTLAPALLMPARVQPAALAAALAFGIGASLLRMAFGGHFLSDTIFAALFTWLVIIATWHAVFRKTS